MSSGSLPPLPALIPIAVLRKSPPGNNNSGVGDGGHRDCAPCANHSKLMGEQRSPRPGRQPTADLIDNARSRGTSAAPQARKIRPERHRKSDRRRDRRRRAKTKFEIEKYDSEKSPERPINPRVNPIFVWVKQEDTRIVEVKCEDYDKRNRLLLTKTPQGWRATPRTETLVPSLKEEADKKHHHHHHHHRSKKTKKHKAKQKSTAVQVSDFSDENQDEIAEADTHEETHTELPDSYYGWESPVNVESLLPSHTIHVVKKNTSGSEQSPSNNPSVNSAVNESAQTHSKCNGDKINDGSPLENLLAVAELEFNQQLQSGQWNQTSETELEIQTNQPEDHMEINQNTFLEDIEQLKNLIESCTQDDEGKLTTGEQFMPTSSKEDCDYTEDDENNLAMDDILTRLEQSLRSPDSPPETNTEIQKPMNFTKAESEKSETTHEKPVAIASKSEEPTDLSLKPKVDLTIEIPSKNDEPEQPTDLSIPRTNKLSPIIPLTPRPASQSSEALQSPQPSGIPAVPPSPDIVSPGANNHTKIKSTFLETLLSSESPKMALNSEVTIERQKEPLDLGKCRKSASPTVTCSEEVHSQQMDEEPPLKKIKSSEPITLKNLLDTVVENKKLEAKTETPKLLELLNKESDNNPITQLEQILIDKNLNIPDPMLVPKEKLSKIIADPGREIPELLKNRPELRLPEALAYPHLLQDPDILVITLQQLRTIIKKQTEQPSPETKTKKDVSELTEKIIDKHTSRKSDKSKASSTKTEDSVKINQGIKELERKMNNDLSEADVAAFNQMLWLPYMNQMEAMQFGGNSDFAKMLTNANIPTTYPTQMSDLSHMLMNNRFSTIPTNFPMHSMNYNNPLEMHMWQDAMMQANMLGPKNNSFKDFIDKMNYPSTNKNFVHNQKFQMHNKQFFQPSNPYMNLPQTYQSNMKSNLHVSPQFGSMYSQRNLGDQRSKHPKMNVGNSYAQQTNQEKSSSFIRNSDYQGTIRTKPTYKLMNNVPLHQKSNTHEQSHHSREKNADGHSRPLTSQPIDLSGATTTTGPRLKVKQHQQLIDPMSHRKLLRHDDIAEVGSTTASIEEMQEAHKHLWHPLFGNEKGYNNPWNWTPSVTASAE